MGTLAPTLTEGGRVMRRIATGARIEGRRRVTEVHDEPFACRLVPQESREVRDEQGGVRLVQRASLVCDTDEIRASDEVEVTERVAGHGRWRTCFKTKRERDEAVMRRRIEIESEQEEQARPLAERLTCAAYADEYIARMESGALLTKGGRRYKDSSLDTTRSQLGHFKREYGARPLAWLDTDEACYAAARWAPGIPAGCVQTTVILVNRAVTERLLTYNPFKGLGRRVEGRANEAPPTEQEFAALLAACDVLGDYGPRFRAMLAFAAHSLLRPGELMAIGWTDIDLPANRGRVERRLYRGRIDLPKSNKGRTFALTPPARDALLTLPERAGLVFRNKTGGQLTQPTLTAYWKEVKARAGLDFDWYMCSKHYGCWYMKVKLGLPNHVIAAQAGWAEKSVEKMVATYTHSEVGALDAIDAAWGTVPDAIPT